MVTTALASPTPTLAIGVALGGGSARGYAHIGALSTLERHGFAPTILAGSSFGAVVGALYATERSPDELQHQAARMRRRDVLPRVVDFGLHRGALFRGRRLEDYFDRLLEGRSFEDLKRKLVVVATDADSGERVLIESGRLAPALRASASLPGIFASVEIDGRRLLDGGIGTPVPIASLDGFDLDLRIGIGAGADADDSSTIRVIRSALEHPWGRRVHAAMGRAGRGQTGALMRALAWTVEGYRASIESVEDGSLHVHIRPPIHWLRFDRAEIAIRAGERALEGAVPALRNALAEATAQRAAMALP